MDEGEENIIATLCINQLYQRKKREKSSDLLINAQIHKNRFQF